jgi:hypothetical protein
MAAFGRKPDIRSPRNSAKLGSGNGHKQPLRGGLNDRSITNPSIGMTFDTGGEKTDVELFFNSLLNGYLVELNKELGYE